MLVTEKFKMTITRYASDKRPHLTSNVSVNVSQYDYGHPIGGRKIAVDVGS